MAMKPLTAEEIAEERENLRENGGDDAVGLPTDRLERLLDEVERSRALLRGIGQLARSAELSGDSAKAMAACFEIERRVAALIGS